MVSIEAVPEKDEDLTKLSPDMETRTPSTPRSASDHSKDDEQDDEQDNEHVSEDEATPGPAQDEGKVGVAIAADPHSEARKRFLQFCLLETQRPEELQTLIAAEHK